MAHVLVYYTLLVVIIICTMFAVKLRKCWRLLKSTVSLGTPEKYKSYLLLLLVSTIYVLRKPKSATRFTISEDSPVTC